MSTPNTHFGAAAIANMLRGAESIFFIGIGGVNMSSLAEISRLRGFRVGGSDRTETETTKRLSESDITVFYSHNAANIEGYDAVVYTVAISQDNPEYRAALSLGIPCISRADYLGYVMTGYRCRIGISGMHGKSTCTSMCALSFMESGADPTILSGAALPAINGSYRIGKEDFFIFEACEYMDSFLDFNPTVAVVLNVEMDHVDYFKSIAQVRRSYSNFISLTGNAGTAVINADDDNVLLAAQGYRGRIVTFSAGGNEKASYYAVNTDMSRGRPSFDIFSRGSFVAHVDLSVPGAYNISNALAAFAASVECACDPTLVARGLSAFTGASRRSEYKGKFAAADVFDDYAHHPTEVAATLRGLRDLGYKRIVCVFQPHTYTRTAEFFDGFAHALSLADRVIVADIYAARETDNLGVSSEKLAAAIGEKAVYGGNIGNIAANLPREVRSGDALIIMGAGDIENIFGILDIK